MCWNGLRLGITFIFMFVFTFTFTFTFLFHFIWFSFIVLLLCFIAWGQGVSFHSGPMFVCNIDFFLLTYSTHHTP